MDNNHRASLVYAVIVFVALVVGGTLLRWDAASTLSSAAIGFSSALLTSLWRRPWRLRARKASPRP